MRSRSQGVTTSKMNQLPGNNGVDTITYLQKKKTVIVNGIPFQESVVTSKKNPTPTVNHVDEIPYVKPRRNYGMAKRKTLMANEEDCQNAKRVRVESIDDLLPSQKEISQQKVVDEQVLELRENRRVEKKKREVQLNNEEKQKKMQKILAEERRRREYNQLRKQEKKNLPPEERDKLREAEADVEAVKDEFRIAQAVAAEKAKRQTKNSKEKGIVKNLNNMFDIMAEPAGKSKSPQKVNDVTVNKPVKMSMTADALFGKQQETPSKPDPEMTLQEKEFVKVPKGYKKHAREYVYFRKAMIVSPRAYEKLHSSEKVKCIPQETTYEEYLTYEAYLKKYEDDQI